MELFRAISPNGGSISAIADARHNRPMADRRSQHSAFRSSGTAMSARRTPSTSFDPRPLDRPKGVRSRRATGAFRQAPRSTKRNAGRSASPAVRSSITTFAVNDGRKAEIDQQRLRHGVRRGRRQAAAGLRLCRVRAVRLRLSALPRRTADDPGVRGLPAQGLARQDRLPQASICPIRAGSRSGRTR